MRRQAGFVGSLLWSVQKRWAATTADDSEDFVLPAKYAAATVNTGGANDVYAGVLGVQREHEPVSRLSRLRQELDTPPKPVGNSSSNPALDEELDNVEGSAKLRDRKRSELVKLSDPEMKALFDYDEEVRMGGAAPLADGGASTEPLPFDDERFAETIVQMETEGVIAEAWQDDRKAKFEDVRELVRILKEMRCRDVCAIDTSNKTASFDYMIFATCESGRHIHLAAWAAQESDRHNRVGKINRRQQDHTWEVVPVGRIVVNLMTEAFRESVSFERKWAVTKDQDALQAAMAPVSEGRQARVHGLWTLTLNLQDLEDFEVDYCKEFLISQK